MLQNQRLTEFDVKNYHDNGYVLFNEPVFPLKKFKALKDYFEEMLLGLEGDKRPESMNRPHVRDVALFEWLHADEVLDLVEPILGPDIVLFSSHFICKPSQDGLRVPWHEDSAYWGTRLTPMEVVTVWLALDDSDEENGCMKVIPGTHDNGYSDYEEVSGPSVFSEEIVHHENFEASSVSMILKENEASLHDGRIVHGSEANESQKRRCGFTMRYISAKTKNNEDDFELYLSRGKSHNGTKYLKPGETFKEYQKYW